MFEILVLLILLVGWVVSHRGNRAMSAAVSALENKVWALEATVATLRENVAAVGQELAVVDQRLDFTARAALPTPETVAWDEPANDRDEATVPATDPARAPRPAAM